MPITAETGDKGATEIHGANRITISPATIEKASKRVACYARTSSLMDCQTDSLAEQEAFFIHQAEADPDVELVDVYSEGLSGTEASNRPEFQRMMRDCRAGKIDEIWCKSISRWARRADQLLISIRELCSLGVNVVFDREHLKTLNGGGELLLSLFGAFSEYEGKSIKANTKMGYKSRMQRGEFFYNRPPYGYDARDGKLVVNREEAAVVKRIFRMSLDGNGIRRIADALQAEGVPTKRGAPWGPSTVRMILLNITYTGDVLLQKTIRVGNGPRRWNHGEEDQYLVEGHHEPIITHDIFDAAQEALIARSTGRRRGDGKSVIRYPFSSKLVCAACGNRLHHYQSIRESQWICAGHKAKKCPLKPVADLAVKNAFKAIISDIDRLMPAATDSTAQDALREVIRQQGELSALRPVLPPEEYARRWNALRREEHRLRFRINGSGVNGLGELRRACRRIPVQGKWVDYEPVFTEHIDFVRIHQDGKMEFHFREGFSIGTPEAL